MNIVMVHSSLGQGGAERVMTILANTYTADGHSVSLLILRTEESAYELDPRVRVVNYEETAVPRWARPLAFLRRARRLRRELGALASPAVLTLSIRVFAVTRLAAVGLGVPVVYSERSNPYRAMAGSVWRHLTRPLSRTAAACVFQTEGARRFYPASLGERATVIPNPVQTPASVPDPAETQALPMIVSVGRLRPEKGHDVTLRAMAELVRRWPELRLRIYGRGPEEGRLRALVGNLGLTDSVEIIAEVSDVRSRLRPGDIFVLSSRYEGMPNSLLEAMAAGLACVAADCDFGPSEIIQDGESGLLTTVGSVRELEAAVSRLLANHELRWAVAHAGVDQMRVAHSADVVAEQYLEVLRDTRERFG